MIKSWYVIGPPAVGKSTLVDGLIDGLIMLDPVRMSCPKGKTPLITQDLIEPHSGDLAGVYLGLRRARFTGTDALGMSVNPQACAWALGLHGLDAEFDVYGEGQRLANSAFLMALDKSTELTVIELQASPATLDERCEKRGSQQRPSWRKAAGTRVTNLTGKLRHLGVRLVTIDADRPAEQVLDDAREVVWEDVLE